MKASLLVFAVLMTAVAASSVAAQTARLEGRLTSAASGTAREAQATTVVPLRVQRLLKRRAPVAAYVPTWVPRGFRYDHYENLHRWGFDLYFLCCDGSYWVGFDAGNVVRAGSCNQGRAMKVFLIDGVRISWNPGQAWRCIRLGDGTYLLLTVSTDGWRTPRELARMVASARRLE